MPIYKSLKEYRIAWNKRAKALKRSSIKSTKQAANLMVAEAKKRAPRSTGETISGIRKRKQKRGYIAESWVPGRFKQNLFANRKAPYRTLNFRKGSNSKYYANNQKVRYGDNAITPSGKQIRWTAKPFFWNRSAHVVKKKFIKFATNNTRKALRVA